MPPNDPRPGDIWEHAQSRGDALQGDRYFVIARPTPWGFETMPEIDVVFRRWDDSTELDAPSWSCPLTKFKARFAYVDSVDAVAAREGATRSAAAMGPPDFSEALWTYNVERFRWERRTAGGGLACIIDHEKAVDPNAQHVPPIFMSVRHPETNEEIREAEPHG